LVLGGVTHGFALRCVTWPRLLPHTAADRCHRLCVARLSLTLRFFALGALPCALRPLALHWRGCEQRPAERTPFARAARAPGRSFARGRMWSSSRQRRCVAATTARGAGQTH